MRSPAARSRFRRTTRLVSLGVILFGPIAVSAVGSGHEPFASYTEVAADAYLAARNPLLDLVLPEGVGGTKFYDSLDDNSGYASAATATIAIAPQGRSVVSIESTEAHERGHLLHAFLAAPMQRLLERLPPPDPSEYAAKDAGEHVGEMVALAWELIAPLEGVCLAYGPAEMLRLADQAVPGTAGFVSLYLRHPAFAEYPDRDALLATADSLTAPHHEEWTAVWNGIEKRRAADGSLTPWPARARGTVREMREAARLSGSMFDHVYRALLLPSDLVQRTVGG